MPNETVDTIAISDVLVPLQYLETGMQEHFLEKMDEGPLVEIARHMGIRVRTHETVDQLIESIVENLTGY